MGRFSEAIAVGIGSAAILGFAYWGLLILLKPLLDRIRAVLHGNMLPASQSVRRLKDGELGTSPELIEYSPGVEIDLWRDHYRAVCNMMRQELGTFPELVQTEFSPPAKKVDLWRKWEAPIFVLGRRVRGSYGLLVAPAPRSQKFLNLGPVSRKFLTVGAMTRSMPRRKPHVLGADLEGWPELLSKHETQGEVIFLHVGLQESGVEAAELHFLHTFSGKIRRGIPQPGELHIEMGIERVAIRPVDNPPPTERIPMFRTSPSKIPRMAN